MSATSRISIKNSGSGEQKIGKSLQPGARPCSTRCALTPGTGCIMITTMSTGAVPLYFRLPCSVHCLQNWRARNKPAPYIATRLECANGVAACEKGDRRRVYQWDYPNGWAALNYLAIKGLDSYGYRKAARRIAGKYVHSMADIYKRTGNLWEKYNAVSGSTDVKDEYAMPGAFMGWTAGVYIFAFDYYYK